MGEVSLVGKVIFVEAKDRKNTYPQYGEFVVVRETPATLYAVSYKGGYDSHDTKALYKDQYTVQSVNEDPIGMAKFVADLQRFSEAPARGEKPQWVEYVYTNAGKTAQELRKYLPAPTVMTVPVFPAASQSIVDAMARRLFTLEQELASLKVKLRSV